MTVGLNLISGIQIERNYSHETQSMIKDNKPIELKSIPIIEANKNKTLAILKQILDEKPDDFNHLGYRLRHIDFAQFIPRGRYERFSGLAPYFRTMMWLGFTGWGIAPISETDKYTNPTAPAILSASTLITYLSARVQPRHLAYCEKAA